MPRRSPSDFHRGKLPRLNKRSRILVTGHTGTLGKALVRAMREEYLLTGPLEPTNEGYALAKIAGIRLAQYYHRQYGLQCINPVPCNLYGPEDSFDLERSHVLSALVRRFVDAQQAGQKEVVL